MTQEPDALAEHASDAQHASDAEIREHLRRNVRMTIIALVVFFVVVVAAMFFFQDAMLSAARWLADRVGFVGLAVFVYISDVILSPIPGDVTLLVVNQSELLREQQWVYVSILGIASTLAGVTGWFLSLKLGDTSLPRRMFGSAWDGFRGKFGRMMYKHGRLVLALGALTPFPFSITCWMAGLSRMPFNRVWPMCMLRIPRYWVYYLMVFYADWLSNWVSSLF